MITKTGLNLLPIIKLGTGTKQHVIHVGNRDIETETDLEGAVCHTTL